MDDDEIRLVRSLLARMRRDAQPGDKPAWALIRKYERLLREELNSRDAA